MPPSGRSRSSSSSRSRSSSSRSSSSRSSSSRSSRSSRSYSSRNSISSSSRSHSPRSNTSYKSNYAYNFNSSYNRPSHSRTSSSSTINYSSKGLTFARNYKRPIRAKSSFITTNETYKPTFHHCYKHDYYYFAEDFFDKITNTQYKKGYYDEEGTYYEDLKIEYSDSEIIELCTCEYCGSIEKIDLKQMKLGETLKCSNCTAILNLDNITTLNTDYYVCDENGNFLNQKVTKNNVYDNYDSQYNTRETSHGLKSSSLIGIILTIIFLIICIPCCSIGFIETIYDTGYYDDYDNYNDNMYNVSTPFGETIYVPEIDRYCEFVDDYYYDEITDCYFLFEENIEYPDMRYWYEDFSSQYGDYGWLEYHKETNEWYVEVDYNTWEVVNNPPDYFWYTSYESLMGNSYSSNSTTIIENEKVYVEEINRYCYLDDGDYYDEQTKCWFYYNNYVTPPVVHYWYEDFSSQYGDYGWLEYDEETNEWYVETSYGIWELVENPPNYFWHTTTKTFTNNTFQTEEYPTASPWQGEW